MDILSTVGLTPMVRINKLLPENISKDVQVWAKLEGFNPSGSIKDRIALKMITHAESAGLLDKSKTIIEATSGNTGISLAMIGAVRGYKVVIVMSEAVSIERRRLIQAYGAKLILTPANEGTDGAIRLMREMIKKDPSLYFAPDQFSNCNNIFAHYKTTAEEIWRQSNGKVTHFVSAIGTSGTIMGVGKGLRENNSAIKIIEAQPVKGHYIQGLKNMQEAIVPSIYDEKAIDERIMVETELAFSYARKLISVEGIGVGMSSGAAVYASIEVAKTLKSGFIVTIFPDRCEKYISTPLFD